MSSRQLHVPRYGSGAVDAVLTDALAVLVGGRSTILGLPDGLVGVVVLVVDGLGRHQLDEHADVAPLLAGAPGPVLDAPFPTTTTTSLASLGTGRPPGEHGLVGYAVAVRGDARPLTLLTWTWGPPAEAVDARADVVPETFQPAATVFERAAAVGVRAVTVLRPEFVVSGLTRAALRGGTTRTASGLSATLDAAVQAVREPGRALVYAHHGELDAAGHVHGPGSPAWRAELADLDAAVAAAVSRLPATAALVVTADHGMVTVPDAGLVELADDPELLDGVRVVAGEPRARQLHAVVGAAEAVRATWHDRFGDVAMVHTRDELAEAGWLGPVVTPEARARVGDVVVTATTGDVSWVHRDVDPVGGRLRGQHGAPTREEMEVPALVLPGGAVGGTAGRRP